MSIWKNTKNGKWYCQGRVHGVRYHKLLVGAKNQEEATDMEIVIRKNLMDIHLGIAIAHIEKRLSDALKLYETYGKIHNRDYKRALQKISVIKDFFKNKYLNEITPNSIEKFIKFLMEDYFNARTKEKGLSNATINRYLACLRKTFSLALKERYIKENPMTFIKDLVEDNEIVKYLTKEEEKELFKNLREYQKPIVFTALRTGLRISNILSLKWTDNIDLNGRYIMIPKQTSKGKKIIQIPISNDLYSLLISLKNGSEYIFLNSKTGKPYTTIYKGFKAACKRAGINNFRFHDLRHTVATRLVNSGANTRNVQDFLGHSSIRTTEKYMHPTKTAKMQIVEILDSYSNM